MVPSLDGCAAHGRFSFPGGENDTPQPAPRRPGLLGLALIATGMLSTLSPVAGAASVDPGAHSFQSINLTDRSIAIASSLGVLPQVSTGSSAQDIVYHRFAVPLGDGTNRETAIDALKYDGDGTLQPVVVTP